MMALGLSWKSIKQRRFTVVLTVISLSLGVALLLGVERMRTEAREGFTNTISGTDLIVGARTGDVSLLLSSVFRIGSATQNISWESYEKIAANPQVAWTIPISLGDSHKGYRVLGTTGDYFDYYKYGKKQSLELVDGDRFSETYDAVLGAEVARKLKYELGAEIILAHGSGDVSFVEHADKPFKVVGILKATGTPVDRAIHVSLAGMEAVHEGWEGHDHEGHNHPAAPSRSGSGDPHAGHDHEGEHDHAEHDHAEDDHAEDDHAEDDHAEHDHAEHDHAEHDHAEHDHAEHDHAEHDHAEHDHAETSVTDSIDQSLAQKIESGMKAGSGVGDSSASGKTGLDRLDEIEAMLAEEEGGGNLQPTQITAFLVGMHSRADAVFLQRSINTYKGEALSAIMPGVAIQELWQVVGVVETTLLVISLFVLGVSLAGMLSSLLASLNERRREMAILRSVGAGPVQIISLIVGEAVLLTAVSILAGIGMLYGLLFATRQLVLENTGLQLDLGLLSSWEMVLLGLVLLVGLLVGLIPAWRCYRSSLADGLTVRL